MADPAASPSFMRQGPETPQSPVLLSVPHAGRDYSDALLSASRLSRDLLETLEDRLMDRLVWRAVAAGATAIIAQVPRAEIDLNRDEREIEPTLLVPPPASRDLVQSAKSRGGLGVVPSRITGAGSIWNRRLSADEFARRIAEVHRPYHAELERLLQEARRRFGIAILLDCHSMPPRAKAAGAPVVLGDRFGTSIGADLVATVMEAVRASGYDADRNKPYAGGYITERHGRPAAGVHALQLELDRSLYLDSKLKEPGPGFDRAAELIERIAGALAAKALGPAQAIAAE